jgi:hypothetical protein
VFNRYNITREQDRELRPRKAYGSSSVAIGLSGMASLLSLFTLPAGSQPDRTHPSE